MRLASVRNLAGMKNFLMWNRQIGTTLLVLASLSACGPSSEQIAQTLVAQTETVEQFIVSGIATGIAATESAKPTNTAVPTSTHTATPSPTLTNTPTEEPTIALVTATPTATATLSYSQVQDGKLMASTRSLKVTLQQLLGGMDTGAGYKWCSVEVKESVVSNYERLTTYPVYDSALLSANGKNFEFHYRVALELSRDDSNVQVIYNDCKSWIAAGKPKNSPGSESAILGAAIEAVKNSLTTITVVIP